MRSLQLLTLVLLATVARADNFHLGGQEGAYSFLAIAETGLTSGFSGEPATKAVREPGSRPKSRKFLFVLFAFTSCQTSSALARQHLIQLASVPLVAGIYHVQ
jgi:hypothetical protein